jgi:hypothetical protein
MTDTATPPPQTVADQAVALAAGIGGARSGGPAYQAAVDQLLSLVADQGQLDQAQSELTARLHHRSDDWDATAGLRLVNAGLAKMGPKATYAWGDRKKRFSRQRTD